MEGIHTPVAAFLLGILGTGHCVGMCGPLLLVLPGLAGSTFRQLLYHLGRILTYVAVGAAMGGLGAGLSLAAESTSDSLAWVVRLQVLVSLVAAGFLLVFALARLSILPEPGWMLGLSPQKLPGFGRLSRSFRERPGPIATFLMGVMLGFLPCGLSYAAFAAALPSGGPGQGALLTACFGVGTLPGLLLVGGLGARLLRSHRRVSDLLSGLLMLGMAVDLLLDAAHAWFA